MDILQTTDKNFVCTCAWYICGKRSRGERPPTPDLCTHLQKGDSTVLLCTNFKYDSTVIAALSQSCVYTGVLTQIQLTPGREASSNPLVNGCGLSQSRLQSELGPFIFAARLGPDKNSSGGGGRLMDSNLTTNCEKLRSACILN